MSADGLRSLRRVCYCRGMSAKHPESMTKAELRAEIIRTGASSLSNAALDAKHVHELRAILTNDRKA